MLNQNWFFENFIIVANLRKNLCNRIILRDIAIQITFIRY